MILRKVHGIKVEVQGKKILIMATSAKKHINEVADVLLKKYGACIAIVVNTSSEHVSFRRSTSCNNINLLDFIDKIVPGVGGGHEYAAGCPINDDFMAFTKCLKKIKNE